MNRETLLKLLKDVKEGKVGLQDALEKLKTFPYDDITFAKIDSHRHLRKGLPEVIFAEGKTPSQIVQIAKRIVKAGNDLLITRAEPSVFKLVKRKIRGVKYHKAARMIVKRKDERKPLSSKKILVISAGTSDIPVAEEAVLTAELMGNKVETLYDVGVAGIHRLLDKKETICSANVIIVVAGMEGALPSVVAGLVDKPVVAVPTSIGYGASFKGISALLTMLNSCAGGVAVVNIDNGFGAGYLAGIINRL